MNDNSRMLQIENLTKRYEHILAVNDLSFHVNRGEIFGLLGSNGAGKTTTLHVIAGLLKPTIGEVFINGMNIREDSLKIKSIMGYLPESPAVYERLTGREFLNFIGRIRGMNESKIKNRVNQLAKILELDDRINSRLSSYSKGMKQKISYASTILHDPDLILLDEPTSGLDARYGRLIKDWIGRTKARNKTIILSTHITELAESLCDRLLILDKGLMKAYGTIDEIKLATNANTFEDAFVNLTGGRIKAEF
jgi:ABC-2 type transport system ATP-binding protein